LDLRMLQVRLLLELLDQAAFHSVRSSLSLFALHSLSLHAAGGSVVVICTTLRAILHHLSGTKLKLSPCHRSLSTTSLLPPFSSLGAQQPATTGGGLFGSSSTGSNAFGSSGGAFGAKPGGIGGLGGSTNNNNNAQDPNSTTKPNPQCPPPSNGTADAPSDPTNPSRTLLWKDERSGEMMGFRL